MTRKHSQTFNSDASVKVEKFDIEWPAELVISPLYTVAVSPTRSAFVYEDNEHVTQVRDGAPVVQKGWRVVFVITKTGLPPIRQDSQYGHYQYKAGEFYDNLIDLHYAIVNYSQAHRPRVVTKNEKVKTIVGTEEYEDND